MTGIPKTRAILYVVLIAALGGALWLRTSTQTGDQVAEAIARADPPIRVPELAAARTMTAADMPIGARDVFRAIPKPTPQPVATVAPQPAEPPKRPDPIEIAVEQAKKSLDAVRLIGVVASGEGALAVFDHDGNTQTRVVGDEIVSGFKLERISQGEIRARHERLGLVAVLSLGGVRPMQWTRIE